MVSGRESAMRQHAAGKAAALGPWTAVAAAATVESIAAATGAMQSQPRASPALRLHPNRSHGPVCRGTKIGAHEFPARVPGVRSEPACAGSPHAARNFVRAHIRKGPSGGRDGECREHPDPGGLCATLAAAARTGGGGVFCDAKRRAGWVCRRGGELTSGGGAEDRDTVLRFKEAALSNWDEKRRRCKNWEEELFRIRFGDLQNHASSLSWFFLGCNSFAHS